MPILSSCCFCLDLRVGTKIIGALKLIGSLMSCIMCACTLVLLMFVGVGIEETRKSRPTPDPLEADDDYIDIREQQENALEWLKDHIDMIKILLYIFLGLSLLLVITTSMLIHGVRRNRQGLLLPFIVQESIMLVVYVLLIILSLVSLGSKMPIIYCDITFVVSFVVDLYFLLVVISQYQALGLIRMHEEISMK
ncbi:uncharacterized protein [Panulirus ornatus]|uniref:uncharacterized protein n=1 Tax=Panulirus ornatus TaxID=150431 RepID=UPI003A84D28D